MVVDAVGSSHLAARSRPAWPDVDVLDAPVEQVPLNDPRNSAPLSVCTHSAWDGSFENTSSKNWIAVFWSLRSWTRSTHSLVQSSIAVYW